MATIASILSKAPQTPLLPQQQRSDGSIQSALADIGSFGLGAVATVGNLFDLPGSSIRDVLAGENPFDQWATPFSSDNRVSGRDLLTQYGLTRKNKETGMSGWISDPLEGVRDLGGFFTEIATDPFGPLTKGLRVSGISAASKMHPVVGAAAKGANFLFDTLPEKLTKPVASAVGSVFRGGRYLFDRFAQGVTNEWVQPVAANVRRRFRETTDSVQAKAAAILKTAEVSDFPMTIDDTLDMADPASWTNPRSPLRVGSRLDAIRNFLEAKPDDIHVEPTLQSRDIVQLGDAVKEVEWVNQTPNGRTVKLVGDDTVYNESALTPLLMRMGESIPEQMRKPLQALRSEIHASRAELRAMGVNVPDWFDAYAAFAPRAKSDYLRQLEEIMQKSISGWRKGTQSLASALKNPGSRELMLGGFKEKTAGINRLYNDNRFDAITEMVKADANPVPIVDALGMPHHVLDQHISLRHVEPFADMLGVDVEDLWNDINTYAGGAIAPRVLAVPASAAQTLIFDPVSGTNIGSLAHTQVAKQGVPGLRIDDAMILEAHRGNRYLDDVMPQLERRAKDAGMQYIEVSSSAEVADKVWKRHGFEPDRLNPDGTELLRKPLRPVDPGVSPELAYPRYLPINDVKRALRHIRDLAEADVKAGKTLGIQPGRGWWSKWSELGVEDVTRTLKMADFGNGRVPLQFDGTPMTLLDDTNLSSFPPDMRDAARSLIEAGEPVYYGKVIKEKGKLATGIMVAPFRTSEIGLKFDGLETKLDDAIKKAPLLHREASSEEFWASIRRNYSDRVDQWMPELSERGIVASDGIDELGAASINEYHRQFMDLPDRVATGRPTKLQQVLLRLDDQSLKALGFNDKAMEVIAEARYGINEQAMSTGNIGGVIKQDASIPVVDRWRALTTDLVENQERRSVAMFGNNPVVDSADYVAKNRMQTTYLHGTIDLLTNVKNAVKNKKIGVSGNALHSLDMQGGVTVGQLLDPASAEHLFGGGDRIVKSTFLENIRQRWVRDGIFKPTESAELINQQIKEIEALRLPSEVAKQLRDFNELPFSGELPEAQGMLRSLQNATTAFKNYALLAPSTGFRDGLSSYVNATVIGDMNPLAIITHGKKAISFARGGMVDPGPGIYEVDQLIKQLGMPVGPDEIARSRSIAFQSLWAAHHRAPSRHANVEFADPSAMAHSGQAEAVLNQFPGAGPGAAQLFGRARDLIANSPAYIRDVMLMRRNPLKDAKDVITDVPGTWTVDDYGRPIQRSTGNLATDTANQFRATIDTTVRATFVMDQLKKGKSLTEAFSEADRVLTNADPRNFTRFERKYMKTLFPFYSFMRQSLPMMLREMVQNPGGKLGMAIRATRLGQGDDKGYVPFQYQDTTAINLGTSDDGTVKYLTSLGLMHEDAVAYAGNILQGDIRAVQAKLLGSMNPAVKWFIESATNTSLFSQGPMGARRLDELDPTLGRIMTNLGLQDESPSGRATPVGGALIESLLSASPASRQLSMAKILTAPSARSGATEKVFRLLAGIRTETVTPEQTVREVRDRLNAMQIQSGARPVTIVSGTEKLQERLQAIGNTEEAGRLKKIDVLLQKLRKEMDKKP